MIEVGKKYHTVDGQEAQIFADTGIGAFKILGAVKKDNGWEAYTWRTNGKYLLDKDSSLDLKLPEQLKACPFCGNNEAPRNVADNIMGKSAGGYFVVCSAKESEGGGCGGMSGWGKTERLATTNWNRRA